MNKKKIFISITLFLVSVLLINNVRAYDAYSIGDKVKVIGEQYYVISDSDSQLDYVTLLKAEPLLYTEVKSLISLTEASAQIATGNQGNKGYLSMAYLYSDTCAWSTGNAGCNPDYNLSSIKQVIDVWADNKFTNHELKEVEGYSARLITFEELRDNLEYDKANWVGSYVVNKNYTPSWVYNIQYNYWTMSPYEDDPSEVWRVDTHGEVRSAAIYNFGTVRPVINVEKSAIEINDTDDNKVVTNQPEEKGVASTGNKSNSNMVNVANTLLSKPVITVIIGLVIVGIGITIYIVILKKKN